MRILFSCFAKVICPFLCSLPSISSSLISCHPCLYFNLWQSRVNCFAARTNLLVSQNHFPHSLASSRSQFMSLGTKSTTSHNSLLYVGSQGVLQAALPSSHSSSTALSTSRLSESARGLEVETGLDVKTLRCPRPARLLGRGRGPELLSGPVCVAWVDVDEVGSF